MVKFMTDANTHFQQHSASLSLSLRLSSILLSFPILLMSI
jgi:hypothetical protein